MSCAVYWAEGSVGEGKEEGKVNERPGRPSSHPAMISIGSSCLHSHSHSCSYLPTYTLFFLLFFSSLFFFSLMLLLSHSLSPFHAHAHASTFRLDLFIFSPLLPTQRWGDGTGIEGSGKQTRGHKVRYQWWEMVYVCVCVCVRRIAERKVR